MSDCYYVTGVVLWENKDSVRFVMKSLIHKDFLEEEEINSSLRA